MKLSTGLGFSKLLITPFLFLLGLQLLLRSSTVHSWSTTTRPNPQRSTQFTTFASSTSSSSSSSSSTSATASRRGFFQQGAAAVAAGIVGTATVASWSLIPPLPAHAATTAALPTPAELERLRRGLSRVQYLLLHWEEETQICGKVVMSDTERRQVIRTEGEWKSITVSQSKISVQRRMMHVFQKSLEIAEMRRIKRGQGCVEYHKQASTVFSHTGIFLHFCSILDWYIFFFFLLHFWFIFFYILYCIY
jgi:hypothetical protein